MKEEEIKSKSLECLSCIIKPCQVGCPLNNDTAGFIKLVQESKYREAYNLLLETTVLSSVCGRICPHEKQCQGMCVKKNLYGSVKIGDIEAFVGDKALENNWSIKCLPLKNKKVAVVGGGPSGLTCAAFLRRNGYNVTIYEKHNYLGGLLYHGIPEFRLNKTLLSKVIDKIKELGINVKLNQSIGKNFSLEDLENEYDAIFLGFGANVSNKMNIPGEDLEGVYGGNELLENGNHPNYDGKVVVVSGGGNVAMDVARTIKRKGAKKVYVIYRRSEKESPAEIHEIEEAKGEGVEFLFQNNILGIYGEKNVERIEVNPDSKIQGPLKTFVLSLFTLASGTLIARGSANKLFGLAKNKKFATSFFQKFGEKFAKVVGKASEKAAAETKGVKKYIFGGLNTVAEHVSNFAKKGIKNKKGTPVYAQKIGEKLSEEAVNTAASVAGFASTAAGLAVDKNGNGKSDILELGKNKREQEAITNLAAAVLDAI